MNGAISFHFTRGGFLRRQWRFVIVSVGNHEILASSELYHNRQDAFAAMLLIKEGAATAQIVNMTV